MQLSWVSLEKKGDERGGLLIAQAQKNIPFDIKRVYCLYDLDASTPRGFHAHKALQQVMVCLSGSCNVILDNGKERVTVPLTVKSDGLFIDKMIWREMHDFSDNCILMVLASQWYDEDDYIRDYDLYSDQIIKKLF